MSNVLLGAGAAVAAVLPLFVLAIAYAIRLRNRQSLSVPALLVFALSLLIAIAIFGGEGMHVTRHIAEVITPHGGHGQTAVDYYGQTVEETVYSQVSASRGHSEAFGVFYWLIGGVASLGSIAGLFVEVDMSRKASTSYRS